VGRLQHADETGVRIGGKLHWVHVNSTRWLTHLAWHPKRGRPALEEIGIWPRFQGRAMRDRWASYDSYTQCAHSICGAHLVRDCLYVAEQEQQEWAGEMADLLLGMAKATEQWRQFGAQAIPADERDAWVAQYFDLLASGFAVQPPLSAEALPKRGGRRKQSAAKNLLDDLLRRADQVLTFLDDLWIPFTNDVIAYCTPSAWLACFVRPVWSPFVGWRKQRNPTAIDVIHGNATCSPPIPDRLWADSIGLCGFTGG
jgi:transposase